MAAAAQAVQGSAENETSHLVEYHRSQQYRTALEAEVEFLSASLAGK